MAIDNYLNQNDSKLKKLKLQGTRLSFDMLKQIAGSVESSKSLAHLDLSNNILRNPGAFEIAQILKRNTSLQKLKLCRNEIREEGIVKVLEALKSNKCLIVLKAEANKF